MQIEFTFYGKICFSLLLILMFVSIITQIYLFIMGAKSLSLMKKLVDVVSQHSREIAIDLSRSKHSFHLKRLSKAELFCKSQNLDDFFEVREAKMRLLLHFSHMRNSTILFIILITTTFFLGGICFLGDALNLTKMFDKIN